MSGITIKGTGRYLPPRIVENEEFANFLETSDEWIRSHTGIARRRIAVDEPTWYMGAEAAKAALADAKMDAAAIDMILVTTVSSDYFYPSTACLVQDAIGAVNAFAIDISVACAGLSYGFDMARRYLCTGDVKTILIVSAERLSQSTNYEDRGTCILLGDGAGASVVQRSDGLFASALYSEGAGARHLYAKRVQVETPFSSGAPQPRHDLFQPALVDKCVMDGHEVYRFATKAMPLALRAACDKAGVKPEELDLIIPHQANLRIIKTAMKNLGLSMDKVFVNIQDYGNASSATIAIALDEAMRGGRLKTGDKLCVVGFGSGLVYGAAVFEV